MSTPHEPAHDTCSAQGCTIARNEESFACQAKACTQEKLCIGCVWTCADCIDDFCEGHIVDLKDAAEQTRFSVFLCYPCLGARRAEAAEAAKEAA